MIVSDQSVYVYGLHGFLGCGADFASLQQVVWQNSLVNFGTPSFFNKNEFRDLDLSSFKNNIQSDVHYQKAQKRIFFGYSFGGRIGLQLLETCPELFDHYLFCSTHPGFTDQQRQEKIERIDSDRQWINRLTSMDWDQFLKLWNQQPTLNNSSTMYRNQTDYSVDLLACALDHYSLGHQKDYRSLIQSFNDKITWIVGYNDLKFLKIADDLEQKKILFKNLKRISGGHRLLFDNPTDLAILVQQAFAP